MASTTDLCHIRTVMPSPPSPISSGGMDLALQAFFDAQNPQDADRQLIRLLESATPLITRCLSRHGRDGQWAGVEDAVSEARTQLTLRLQRLRADGGNRVISDFAAYTVAVARTAWAQGIRQRHPARAMLLNRLRYLLEGRTPQSGFALWTGPGGEPCAGFERWRDRPFPPSTGASAEKRGRLLADPTAIASEIFGLGHAESSLPLADLVAKVFSWLGEPLRLRDLVDAVAPWQNVHSGRGEPLVTDMDEEYTAGLPDSRQPSPHDALRWKESLQWLLRETTRLPLRQRTAFLLHSSCLFEMESLGLIGVRQSAAILEMPPEQLAEHWSRLPLEDRVIAALLRLTAQQVVNLRKAARTVLGRAWQRFLHGV